jgi:rfaE bifunctional protein kinase chain/domain
MAAMLRFTYPHIGLPPGANSALEVAVRLMVVVPIVWAVYNLVDVIAERMSEKAARTESKLDDQLVPLVRADLGGVSRAGGYVTPVKTRILAGGVHSAKQQVVRMDRAARQALPEAVRKAVARRLSAMLSSRCDALLVSDYGTGLVTAPLVAAAQRTLRGPGRRQPPVLIDSRYALLKYRRMTMCTPNESEVEQLLGVTIGENARILEKAGRELLRRTAAGGVLITRGSRGMALFEPERPTLHIPIFGSDQIADVTGAGDTVIATMTLALAAGASCEEAARLANYAGGLVVMKRGTATITMDELKNAIRA